MIQSLKGAIDTIVRFYGLHGNGIIIFKIFKTCNHTIKPHSNLPHRRLNTQTCLNTYIWCLEHYIYIGDSFAFHSCRKGVEVAFILRIRLYLGIYKKHKPTEG